MFIFLVASNFCASRWRFALSLIVIAQNIQLCFHYYLRIKLSWVLVTPRDVVSGRVEAKKLIFQRFFPSKNFLLARTSRAKCESYAENAFACKMISRFLQGKRFWSSRDVNGYFGLAVRSRCSRRGILANVAATSTLSWTEPVEEKVLPIMRHGYRLTPLLALRTSSALRVLGAGLHFPEPTLMAGTALPKMRAKHCRKNVWKSKEVMHL